MKIRNSMRPIKFLTLPFLALILMIGCSKNNSEADTPINRDMVQAPVDIDDSVKVPTVENTIQISKSNFDQIKNGMTLLDVEILIAGTVRKVTSVKKDGVLKETYRWETKDGSKYIEILTEDEKVVGKNQKGLK